VLDAFRRAVPGHAGEPLPIDIHMRPEWLKQGGSRPGFKGL